LALSLTRCSNFRFFGPAMTYAALTPDTVVPFGKMTATRIHRYRGNGPATQTSLEPAIIMPLLRRFRLEKAIHRSPFYLPHRLARSDRSQVARKPQQGCRRFTVHLRLC
jgi:hypothetical protein